ncbi:hypothetical protein KJ657_02660 [Patescibacteria group bacterium]|nr:hypothetical protein [Patescibacteria group bacterium]MBU1015969.1 hypothetical protein [Patescibacteria group bacterium]MBU1684822.1 hypothetical protein [Patescibacteria group bacterium]MBU1938792.1 hypothetical protein [Patescibacteria group bacterium]
MPETNIEQFDPGVYLDDLIREMGMQDEDRVKLAGLKQAMFEALSRQLFQAAEDNIEPEVIDVIMEELADEEDPGYILRELMRSSPGVQIAMVMALDEFRENTLEAFNKLKI